MVEYTNVLVAMSLHVIDFISGIIAGAKQHKIESAKMRDGMFKKSGFLLCYILGIILDKYGTYLGLPVGESVLQLVVTYSVMCELVSIAENIHKINPVILPDKLLKFFNVNEEGDD